MSVRDSLDDYARRMDTDGAPDVVFVVEAWGFEPPRVRVSLFERIRSVADPTGEKAMTAPWTVEELYDCAQFLHDIASHLRYRNGRDPDPFGSAVPAATAQRERRTNYTIERELKKAADEAARPWVCVCGKRWKTERGMKQHQRACWRIDPLTGQPEEPYRAQS